MFPPPAPEQLLLQALVPDDNIDAVTDAAIQSGSLDKVGSGAVLALIAMMLMLAVHSLHSFHQILTIVILL